MRYRNACLRIFVNPRHMRSEGYGTWSCVSVCLSVKSHLTSGASVILKILSCTQRVTEVKKFVGFS